MLILWLILFTQRDFVACGVVVFPPMAHSQRKTQIRWAASEMSIRRRQEDPRVAVLGRCWVVVDRELQPRMVPIVMRGREGDSDGQAMGTLVYPVPLGHPIHACSHGNPPAYACSLPYLVVLHPAHSCPPHVLTHLRSRSHTRVPRKSPVGNTEHMFLYVP